MRICFIADSSSIHVRRIVLHFLQKGDDVLVLSSAQYRTDIPGATTVYLLNSNKIWSNASPKEDENNRGFARFVKCFISPSLKFFIKFTLRSLALLRKRTLCMEEIERFSPEVIYCFRSCPEGIL